MSNKRIHCKNKDGMEVVFQYDFAPFFLLSVEGVYGYRNKVTTSENTMTDGSTYQGSTTEQRNIVITAQMDGNYKESREHLYRVFKPKSAGIFSHIEDGEVREIDYRVESINIDEKGVVRNIVLSLICTQPLFRAPYEVALAMASWEKLFEFPHEFTNEPEELSRRVAEQVKDIDNESEAEKIGITITFTAYGPVEGAAIHHIESGDFIKLNRTLQMGNTVIITTHSKNKHVWLIEDGQKTDISADMDLDSEFIQLRPGKNTLTYNATSGVDYLYVDVAYTFLYGGL